jgi:NADH-quinone oxidoreductase subunit A
MQLADTQLSDSARTELSARLLSIDPAVISPAQVIDAQTALQLGWLGLADILVFFGVLLVGFAYVWKRGDLNWIRAVSKISTGCRPDRSCRTRLIDNCFFGCCSRNWN